jgi:hypothetical protein
MPAFEGTATQNEDQMYFNWQDNSGMGNAEDTDIAMYWCITKIKKQPFTIRKPPYVPVVMPYCNFRLTGRTMN